jgi:hypothetical protein
MRKGGTVTRKELIQGIALVAMVMIPATIKASGLLNAMEEDAPQCDAPETRIALLDQLYDRALTQARVSPQFAARPRGPGDVSLFQQIDWLRNHPLLLIESATQSGTARGRRFCVATISYRLGNSGAAHISFTTSADQKLGDTIVSLGSGWQRPAGIASAMALHRYLDTV